MQRMSYEITAKGFEGEGEKRAKVFYGLTSDGRVMRQASNEYGGQPTEVGQIEMTGDGEAQRKEFAKITGLDANTYDDEPTTGELDANAVTKTSPRRTRQTRAMAGNPNMPTIGKSVDGEADIDEATVTSDPADPSLRPTKKNDVEQATAERIANEGGQISDVQRSEIERGEEIKNDGQDNIEPKDNGTVHGNLNARTGVTTTPNGDTSVVGAPRNSGHVVPAVGASTPNGQPEGGNPVSLETAKDKVSDAVENGEKTKVNVEL